jgi:threonine dehydrogenase-like Zn-dependent dehydrogenase
VFVTDIAEDRLKLLPDDAAIVPVNSSREEVAERVREATDGRMADVVFEVTGNEKLIPSEFRCLRRQGRFIVLSSPRGATSFDFHDLCNSPSYTIIGAHILSHPQHGELDLPWTIRRNGELFFDLLADGDIELCPLITSREPYTEAVRLYTMLLEDRSHSMGIVLEWPD